MELVKQKKPKVTGLSTWKVFEAEGNVYEVTANHCFPPEYEDGETVFALASGKVVWCGFTQKVLLKHKSLVKEIDDGKRSNEKSTAKTKESSERGDGSVGRSERSGTSTKEA